MEVSFYVKKKYIVVVEVLKYPCCVKGVESKQFLSEKICFVRKMKLVLVYGQFIYSLGNGLVPT